MYTHPEIHLELARQREAELCRRASRHVQHGSESSDPLAPVVTKAAAGDDAAWESLVTRFDPALRAVVSSYRLTAADTDDVIQAAWSAAFLHIDRLREPEAFGGWLIVIARRQALGVLKRLSRETPADETLLNNETTGITPETTLLDAERSNTINAAIDRLPRRQHAVIGALLRDSDATYGDLAHRLGMPLGSIGPTRDRALARLRRDRRLKAIGSRE